MPNGEDDRAEVERKLREKEAAGDQAGPASNPPAEVIDDRFTDKQRAWARDTADEYVEKHGDQLVVGRVTSNVGPNYGELRKGIMPGYGRAPSSSSCSMMPRE